MTHRPFVTLITALAVVVLLFALMPMPRASATVTGVSQSPLANAVPGTGSVTVAWTQNQACNSGEVQYWVNDFTHAHGVTQTAAATPTGTGPYTWTATIPQQSSGDVIEYQVHNFGTCTEEFGNNLGRDYGYGQGPSSTTTYHAIHLNSDVSDWRTNEVLGVDGSITYYATWDANYLYIAFNGGIDDTSQLNIAIDTDPGTNNITGTNATSTFAGATFAGYLTPEYIVQSTVTNTLDVYTRTATSWGTATSIYAGGANLSRSGAVAEIRIPRGSVSLGATSNAVGIYLWVSNNLSAVFGAFGTDNPTFGTNVRMRTETVWNSSGSGLSPSSDANTDHNNSEVRTLGISSLRNLYVSNGVATLSLFNTTVTNVTIASGATLQGNVDVALTVNGNWTNDGAFTPEIGPVVFNGPAAHTLAGASATNFYDTILNDGLLGYWKFDEGSGGTALDSSGHGYNGVLTGGPTYTSTVPSSIAFGDPYAISTPGDGAWVNMGNLSQFMNLGDFTISQWVLLNNVSSAAPNDFATPLGKGTFNHHGWLVLFNRSTTASAHEIRLYLNPDLDSSNIAATIPAPPGGWVAGQWYHYAFTRNGSTITGYLNGVQQVVATDSTVPGTNTASLAIGRTSANSYFWDGLVDETRIYNRGLSATEIQALATGHRPNTSWTTLTLGAPISVSHQLRINSGTFDVSAGNYAVAVQGDLERNGGIFNPSGGTVTFNGAGVQNLNTDAFTFNNVTVGTGVTLTTSADVTVTNALSNAGTTRELKAVNGTNAIRFGLANITITPTVQGSLSNLDVLRRDQDHPNRTGTAGHGVGWGRYWTITPNTGANNTFSATLTLPHNGLTDPRACKYPGNLGGFGWDCDDGTHTTSTASTVTRSSIGSFSDWSVGGIVGPTAITLRNIGATSYTSLLVLTLIATATIIIGGAIVWRRKR